MKKKTPVRKRSVVEKTAKRPVAQKAGGTAQTDEKEKEEEAPQDLETLLKGLGHGSEEKRVSKWASVQCPYCGENFEVHFDSVEDGHSVQEDCAVCCKGIMLTVSVEDEDSIHVSAYRA
ncbi:MAG: CPXCG motif-containing cysteine-rich protein [Elusimicrobia bacterium]|nr:CPXCG motif-containing cysteine-rich protein [Elusimicrobiota bacterium]